jgi:hypothetical protein
VFQSRPGDFLDELENFRGTEEERVTQLTRGVNEFFDDSRARRVAPRLNIKKQEDALKAAELFYLTSKTRWNRELKKEKISDRDYLDPLYDCFRAGSYEVLLAQNDEQRDAAHKKFTHAFNSINDGMEKALGRIDKSYELVVLQNKAIYIENSDKVYAFLKAKREY